MNLNSPKKIQMDTGGIHSHHMNQDWSHLENMLNDTDNESLRLQSPLHNNPSIQNSPYEPLLSPYNPGRGELTENVPREGVFLRNTENNFYQSDGNDEGIGAANRNSLPTPQGFGEMESRMHQTVPKNLGQVQYLSPTREYNFSKHDVDNLEKENYVLERANDELMDRVNSLEEKLREYRTSPNQVEIAVSDSLSLKLSKAEGEIERLKVLLQGKNDIIEELKVKLKKEKRENFDTENLTKMLRDELRLELEEKNIPIISSYKERALKSEQEYDLVKIELEAKERELELAEKKIDEIADKEIDKIEEVKKSIRDKLWSEYEKKIMIKQEEFEKRISNNLEEIANLNDNLSSWRDQCSELEEKNAKLIDDLNLLGREEVSRRQEITEYETRKGDLELEIEKLKAKNLDLEDQLKGRQEKLSGLEAHIIKIEEKNHKCEDEKMNVKSKFGALNKEIEQMGREVKIWKRNTQNLEDEISKKNMEINELRKELTLNNFENDAFGDELELERGDNNQLTMENFKLHNTSKMQDDIRIALESELKKNKNEAENLRDQLELANESARRWKEEYDKLKQGYEDLNTRMRNEEVETNQRTMDHEIKVKMETLDELTFKIEELQNDYETLGLRENEAIKRLKMAEMEIELQRKKNSELGQNHNSINQKLNKYKDKYNQLKAETRKLLDTNKYLREQVQNSQEIIQKHKNEFGLERQKVGSLINDISRLQAQNNQLVSQDMEKAQILEENAFLRNRNQELGIKGEDQLNTIKEYEARMDKMLSEINEKNKIKNELEAVISELNSKEQVYVRASLDVKQSTAQSEALKTKLEDVQDELQNLKMIRDEEFQNSKETIMRFENEVETLKVENNNFQINIEQLKSEMKVVQDRAEGTINQLTMNIQTIQERNQNTILQLSEDIKNIQEMKQRELTEKEQILLNQNKANVDQMKQNMQNIQIQNQNTIKRLVENMKILEVKNLELSGTVTDIRGKYEVCNSQLNQARKNIENFKVKVDCLMSEKTQLQNSHGALLIAQSEIDMLKQSLAAKESLVKNMAYEISTLKEQIMGAQQELNLEKTTKINQINAVKTQEFVNSQNQKSALVQEIKDLRNANIQNVAVINRVQREKSELEGKYLSIIKTHEIRLKEVQDLQRLLHQKDSQMQLQMMNRNGNIQMGADLAKIRGIEDDLFRANQLIRELRDEARRLRQECIKHQDVVKEWQSKYFDILKDGTLDENKIRQKVELLHNEMQRLANEVYNKDKEITLLKQKIIENLDIQRRPGAR